MERSSDQSLKNVSQQSVVKEIKTFLSHHSLLYRYAGNQIKRFDILKKFLGRFGLINSIEKPVPTQEMNRMMWTLLGKLIEGMRSFAETNGAKFIVFEVVGGDRYSHPAKELKNITDRLKVPLLQFHEPFLKNEKSGKYRMKDQIHWNEFGHAKAAELIYQFLQTEDRKARNLHEVDF
jgi:hypothetical protein